MKIQLVPIEAIKEQVRTISKILRETARSESVESLSRIYILIGALSSCLLILERCLGTKNDETLNKLHDILNNMTDLLGIEGFKKLEDPEPNLLVEINEFFTVLSLN